jgi:transposase-like protein
VVAILEDYWSSGLTQRVFAQRVGISVSSLQLWLRQARLETGSNPRKTSGSSATPSVSLLEVDLEGGAAGGSCAWKRYEIKLPNGARLRLGSGFGDEGVRRLLKLLEEAR